MAKVIVKINPKTGESTYEVNGVEGSKCEEITEAITRSNDEVDKQYTEEYHVPDTMPDYITDPMEGMDEGEE